MNFIESKAMVNETANKESVRRKWKFTQKDYLGYLFVIPCTIIFIMFTLVPIVLVFVLALTDFNGISFEGIQFKEFNNFKYIFTTGIEFWDGMLNIVIYTFTTVPYTIVMSLVLALIVFKKLPLTKVFRGIFYIPGITSVVASATVWRYLLDGNGIINNFIEFLNGAFGADFSKILLNNSATALWGPILMACWGSLGGNMVLFIAALGNVPESVQEAAKVDGASAWRTFFSITLPCIWPAIFFASTLALIGAPQMFEPILALDANTTTPVYEIYKTAVKGTSVGLGCAQSVLLFIFIMIITFFFQRFNKESYF